jgi:hypothetical protein
MVQVTLSAQLQVAGGPTLPLSHSLEPETYAVTTSLLAAAPSGGETKVTVPLLPPQGTVVLLALRARSADSSPADVDVVLVNAAKKSDQVAVSGSLLLVGAGVLAALVDGGPRALDLTNKKPVPVTVDVLSCLDTAP